MNIVVVMLGVLSIIGAAVTYILRKRAM
jgi:hypothetical protein